MRRLIEIFGIIFLGILFLYCVGHSQTQRPVVLTVLGGAIPQDSLSNKIYVKDSSLTNNTSGYYVSTTMGMTLAPKASPTFSGTLTHTGNFISATSNGTPRVTIGTVAGTGSGNFIADTALVGFIKPASKSAGIDSFATTATRKAVYIAGATADDIYFISPRLNYAQGTPVAAVTDSVQMNYFAKTDSLIVVRVGASGGQTGTSGRNFSWIRMKGQ